MKNLFNKIKLLDSITNSLVAFGVNSGNVNLQDYVDLNCGAVPEGEYEQVIDPGAPEQFLSLYVGIAQKRFAFAVMALIRMNPDFEKSIEDFMYSVGKDMNLGIIPTEAEAMQTAKAFVLDTNPEEAWKAAEGTIGIYRKLMQSFVNGLLSACEFSITLPFDP